jgi:SAM-dependent methyltransferase
MRSRRGEQVRENQQAIDDALTYVTMDRFRAELLSCDEFRDRNRFPSQKLSLESPAMDIEWTTDRDIDALIAHVKGTWTRLGLERPHWSVLSSEQFLPAQIANHEADFYASGAKDAGQLLATLARNGISAENLSRAFEFGCGIGRVTPHLSKMFTQVSACDVSSSHLEIARRVVTKAQRLNVDFHLVQNATFGMSRPFDLWHSRIVLQHNPPPIIALILRRAFSLLAPGGVAVFQVPTYAPGYRFRTADYLRSMGARGEIEMHVFPQAAIFQIARDAGCDPLEVTEDDSAGVVGWISNVFVFRKAIPARVPA